jgi:AraC-like DNA-binding protein
VRATDDVDVASAVLSDSYAELLIRLPAAADRFGMRFERFDLPDVQLALLDLSSAQVHTVPYPAYTVCFPVRGRLRALATAGSVDIGDGCGAVVGPTSGRVEVDYLDDDCRVLTVTVAREPLERELEVLLGRPVGAPIRFDLAVDVARCGSLSRSLDYVRAELADPSGLHRHGSTAGQLSRLLLTGLLLDLPHDWSDELQRPAGFEGPRPLRQVVDAIAADPVGFVTVADIARASGLSVRALESGFRRHLGTTPMAHVRAVRLARVRDDLARAEPGSTTVTAVANRWGFTHYGRFTAQYRRRFGCSPRQTLDGSPRLRLKPS